MNRMTILVAMPKDEIFFTFFDEERVAALEALGEVTWNETRRQFTHDELCEQIRGKEICVTGWGAPQFDADVMHCADRLRLLAHTGGSVSALVSQELYDRGVRVVSGNDVFAESVAEGVIAYALAALRKIPYISAQLAAGVWCPISGNRGLLGRSFGIVGYGMIARHLVEMLEPFRCRVKVFSRHISHEELESRRMEQAGLEEIFRTCDIVSIHTGLTDENYHLVTEEMLRSMKPGALLINTARGAIIDEPALCRVLADRPDLFAALDVYETEPLPAGHPLQTLPNVQLMPHQAGPTVDRRLSVTRGLTEDIRRFLAREPMNCEISASYAKKMSGK